MTWSQVHQRARVVAEKLLTCGSAGERAVILAPQSLDYVIAFLGAIQAGFIAVPLSVPQFGQHDERVSGALRDCAPVAVLTTSAVVDDIRKYAQAQPRQRGTTSDRDRCAGVRFAASPATRTWAREPRTAYLQYTSGSTRQPAGVVDHTRERHRESRTESFPTTTRRTGRFRPPDTTVVSWLPFYHDMGLISRACSCPMIARAPGSVDESGVVHAEAGPVDAIAGEQHPGRSRLRRTSRSNWRCAGRRTRTWPGSIWATSSSCSTAAERVHDATLQRFYERFAKFNLPDTAMRPSYGLAEATLYLSSAGGPPAERGALRPEKLSAGQAERSDEGGSRWSAAAHRGRRWCASSIPRPGSRSPAGKIGEIWVHGDNVAMGYWRSPQLTERTFGGQLSIRRRARRRGRGCGPATWG